MEPRERLEKKPPASKIKSKVGPPVRQTLTSYTRMLNANPLLELHIAGVTVDEFIAQKSSNNLKTSSFADIRKAALDALPSTSRFKKPEVAKKPTIIPEKPQPKTWSENTSKKPIIEIKAKVNSFPNGYPRPKQVKPKFCSSKKRSLSAGDIKMNKKQDVGRNQVNINKSQENVCTSVSNEFKEFSPIMESGCQDNRLFFRTPSAYNRRSVCHHTPHLNKRASGFQASTPAPIELQKLQERLNRWLKSRGKPPASFHHLRIFGSKSKKLPVTDDDENKENIEINNEKSDSYEYLNINIPEGQDIANGENSNTKNKMTQEDLARYAKEAVSELLRLIDEDYPRDQCSSWLELIREKYDKIDDEPEYWECRAAIERSAGNIQKAVEFYKTAIIQGAEVNSVDKSLDQLLEKFNLLNINPTKVEKHNGKDERIAQEMRNIFKSSVIQFAVQERRLKKKKEGQTPSTKLLAVPVRRSTRSSRSSYTHTPGVKICSSLRDLNLSPDEISFEKNKAL